MEKIKLTEDEISEMVKRTFVSSNFSEGRLINKKTGVYVTPHQAKTFIVFSILASGYLVDKNELHLIVATKLLSVSKINPSEVADYYKIFPEWKVFEDAFKSSRSANGRDVFKTYKAAMYAGDSEPSMKEFYTSVRRWASELGYYLNFKNRLGNRKILIAKD